MAHTEQDYIRFIERNLADAKAEGFRNISAALNILLDDIYKWQSEYEAGTLDGTAATIEIACLYEFAKGQIALGEQNCDPEALKSYLTV